MKLVLNVGQSWLKRNGVRPSELRTIVSISDDHVTYRLSSGRLYHAPVAEFRNWVDPPKGRKADGPAELVASE